MAEIQGGTLYDINKSIIKTRPLMGEHDFNKQLYKLVDEYLTEMDNTYYMLLCRERNDYTLFSIHKISASHETADELKVCLVNRGNVWDVRRDENGAIEIWLKIDNEPYCYYFFAADPLVVDIY